MNAVAWFLSLLFMGAVSTFPMMSPQNVRLSVGVYILRVENIIPLEAHTIRGSANQPEGIIILPAEDIKIDPEELNEIDSSVEVVKSIPLEPLEGHTIREILNQQVIPLAVEDIENDPEELNEAAFQGRGGAGGADCPHPAGWRCGWCGGGREQERGEGTVGESMDGRGRVVFYLGNYDSGYGIDRNLIRIRNGTRF